MIGSLCNTVMYLDGKTIQHMLKYRKAINHLNEPEFLLPCSYCGSVAGLRVGMNDYSKEIEKSINEMKKRLENQNRACTLMQKLFRGYITRKRLRSIQEERDKIKNLQIKSALSIECFYRQILAKRRVNTFKYLKRIKNTSPIVLEDAISSSNEFHVFWYDNENDLNLIYKDYKLFVEKTGNFPPLRVVEENIEMIYKRVHALECNYSNQIQKVFRGFLGRRCSKLLKIANAKIMEIKLDAILTIQGFVRSWLCKRITKRFELERLKNDRKKLLNSNTKTNKKIMKKNGIDAETKKKIIDLYSKEKKEEMSGEMIGLLCYTEKKMINYMNSSYGNGLINKEMTKFSKERKNSLEQSKKERKEVREKLNNIREKISENGAYKHYYAIEKEVELEKKYLEEYINSIQ